MKRVGILLAAAVLLMCLTACRARVDLTELPDVEDIIGGLTSEKEVVPTAPEEEGDEDISSDEMADYAREVYRRAMDIDASLDAYDIQYTSTAKSDGMKVQNTEARIICLPDGDEAEMLLSVRRDGVESLNYYKSGVGYFSDVNGKYWIPMALDEFMEESGFSESVTLPDTAFDNAVVIENEDGTLTVSCPLSGQIATLYMQEIFGLAGTPQRMECCVTVDERGAPLSIVDRVTATVYGAMTVSMESENRYLATGKDVVLTPPADLDDYEGQWDMP